MAMENSSSKSGAAAADSYVGSLISLTSKSEIRYEGILYNINPEESSIGLRNVRSFGTEGRKKDGPQVPPSDKVYEYILFRGSDIKDLQVKASPPAQPTLPINNDPAIIQSHYPRPLSTSNSLPSGISGSMTDLNSHSAQVGLHGSGFQGGPPLYQPGGNLGSWGASPPPPGANPTGLAMPLYWQGYYGPPPNGLPLLHQQPLLRPPPGLSMPPSLQQPMQYPNISAPLPIGASSVPGSNLPETPSSLLSLGTSTPSLASSSLAASTLTSSLPSTLPSVPSASLTSETLPSALPNKASITAPPNLPLKTSLPPLSLSTATAAELSKILPPISSTPSVISGPISLPHSSSPPVASIVGASNGIGPDKPKPSLVTPGQLLQSGFPAVSLSQPVQASDRDVEVVQVLSFTETKQAVPVTTEAQPPILPLPVAPRTTHKPNGAPFQTHNGYRGRGRGRGRGAGRSYQVTKFAEDFDFTAMNEKFKKDEVWGHLGRSTNDKPSDEDGFEEEDDADLPKMEIKPVYNKDDFFDSLSSHTLDRDSQNDRPRFSEQRKLDTETFGEFSRYRGGRGGRGYARGGRYRGGYYGGGGGYGYGGRGRGGGMSNRTS